MPPSSAASTAAAEPAPVFRNASVHDPSVIRADGAYYVFGSHLASAKSADLLQWTQLSDGVYDGNKLMPNVKEELAETFAWAQTDTLWAPDVIRLADGKYYLYYNACKGDSPRSALGIAVSDAIEGPYRDTGIILKSGMWGEAGEDGTLYDAARQPNVVDPNVFFDKTGKLWMVYGSYSGGIFLMKLDPATGKPLPGQGYGKRLLGGNHSRIEGPYVLYSPETDYYYLFLSFGGLDANGGYNIRVARSRQPDGPYLDPSGQDMSLAAGADGTMFDDRAIEPFGAKLMGNVNFVNVTGELPGMGTAYVSPGHNSAYYDSENGKYYLFFHTRSPSGGERHEIRVHQMFLNADGWPVVTPHRYGGETIGRYSSADAVGDYKFINHGKAISAEIPNTSLLSLNADGSITGAASGTWTLRSGHEAELILDGARYRGVFLRQWDGGTLSRVMTFSALSADGRAIWGSHTAPQP